MWILISWILISWEENIVDPYQLFPQNWVENRVDHDQLASQKPADMADQDPHCFQKQGRGTSLINLQQSVDKWILRINLIKLGKSVTYKL